MQYQIKKPPCGASLQMLTERRLFWHLFVCTYSITVLAVFSKPTVQNTTKPRLGWRGLVVYKLRRLVFLRNC